MPDLTRYAHWHNGGINIRSITYQKVVNLRLNRSFVQGKTYCYYSTMENWAIKWFLIAYCYTHRSVPCSAKRSFLLQYMGSNTETQIQLVTREGEILEPQCKLKCLHQILPLLFKQLCVRGGGKIIRTRGVIRRTSLSVSTKQGVCSTIALEYFVDRTDCN